MSCLSDLFSTGTKVNTRLQEEVYDPLVKMLGKNGLLILSHQAISDVCLDLSLQVSN